MKKWLKGFATSMALTTLFCTAACNGGKPLPPKPIVLDNVTKAKNVILLIGDGMGPNQIKAGNLYKGDDLYLESFPYQTMVETNNALGELTDSAAASTAMATGTRTLNKYVGLTAELEELTTIVDIASGMGKRTGIIATEELTGATPMGFAAHAESRNNKKDLLKSAAATSNVNFFASYTMQFAYQDIIEDAGYTKIADVDAISDCTAEKAFGTYLIKAAAETMSAEAASVAFDRLLSETLDYLSQDEDGFFLMAEGSHIDHGGHDNDLKYMIDELLAFDNAVHAATSWAKEHGDTVVIVTADHETGGLQLTEGITEDNMREAYETKGESPYYSWTTTGHTPTDVYCFINGADIAFENYSSFNDKYRIKNTDIFKIIQALFGYTPTV